jgi:DNA-binding PadR family transcriptional regulator
MMTLNHSKILTALLSGDSTRTDLRERSGVYGSTCTHALAVMFKHCWITDEQVEGMKTRIVSITHEGKQALKRFNRGEVEGQKVVENSINRMVGNYTPPAAYYRNNGNVHIPSLGYRC